MTEPGYTPPDLSLFGDDHIRQYLETDGRVGHEWNGVPTLVLTTTGRTTGLPRQSVMIYGRDRDAYVIIASQGGMPTHPNWYLNLAADPEVDVQVGALRFRARARTAEGEERARLWTQMAALWPNFDVYVTRTERHIPLVVLDPMS